MHRFKILLNACDRGYSVNIYYRYTHTGTCPMIASYTVVTLMPVKLVTAIEYNNNNNSNNEKNEEKHKKQFIGSIRDTQGYIYCLVRALLWKNVGNN